MGHTGIRLGPLALLLAVVSICVATLSILAIATANADLRIAGQYADTVKRRYELDTEGQVFLSKAEEAVLSGKTLSLLPDADTDADGVTWNVIEKKDGTLTIGIKPRKNGSLEVVCWKIGKTWEPEAGMENLWDGQ